VILALVQARMRSDRLPGKVMAPLAGIPMVEHVVRRTAAAELIDRVCVCIPDGPADDVLAAHLAGLPCDVYRGSEDDVLGRFYWASQRYPDANPIVRITSDDPFKDPALIDHAVSGFLTLWAQPHGLAGAPQYLHLGGLTWPLGLDVEVFTRDALEEAYRKAHEPEDREHVTRWMQRHLLYWQLKDDKGRGSISSRWTVDTPNDFGFASWVYSKLYDTNPLFGYDDVLGLGL